MLPLGHMQIAARRRSLERDRREKLREAMAAYDKVYDARLQELHEACGRIGHHFKRMDFGSDEGPVICRVCGAAK